jgi:hypothetical protein
MINHENTKFFIFFVFFSFRVFVIKKFFHKKIQRIYIEALKTISLKEEHTGNLSDGKIRNHR